MNSKQIMIISTVIVLAIFSSACTQTGAGQIYRTGTQGLSLTFLDSNTKSVYEGEEFGLSVDVKNEGSVDVTTSNAGKLKVSYDNYRLKAVDENSLSSPIALNGKSQYYPVGDEFPISFYFTAQRLTQLREGATTTINFNLCYPYHTELTTMTCIDTKKANNDQSASSCSSENYDGASGQGAPIVITRIEPEILIQSKYVRPQFKIYIENKGAGYVTLAKSCSDDTFTNKDIASKVEVTAWLSGKTKLECGPDKTGIIRLTDSESFITCYLPQNDKDYNSTAKNYITSLTVNLSYTYMLIGKYDIDIKHNDNLEPVVSSGKCLTYEVVDPATQKCVDKCSYCANNPQNSICTDASTYPVPDFSFNNDFGCACSLSDCNSLEGKGDCIKGYCPGNLYCCNKKTCDAYQIEYDGACIDKCAYCANTNHAKDTAVCGTFDFTDFKCQSMTSAECNNYAKDKACIAGYCGGANKDTMYCANPSKATIAPDTTADTTIPTA